VIILALDPSPKAIGWCLYDVDADGVITTGEVCKHSDKDIDNLLYKATKWLRVQLRAFGRPYAPNIIALEMPVYVHNAKTFGRQNQLAGALKMEIINYGVKAVEVYPSERRKAMKMNFKGKSAKEVKRMIMDEVNQRYELEITSDHVSDAVAIALAARDKLDE